MHDAFVRLLWTLIVVVASLLMSFGGYTTGVPMIDRFASIVFVIVAFSSIVKEERRVRAMRNDVRPRRGFIEHVDGTRTELVFIETSTPNEFVAVALDGQPLEERKGDTLTVDVLGPGQAIVMPLTQEVDDER